ncbi:hypothetical protein [Citricoccus sp. NR2]|uniref:hypothetical protein n=1 Tax=Citricoccus sp. NR2 TaxID=3004095 RepID=UPI0022DD9C61|nr:hypothetical protein [Citricoccus sp. NR2]WBL20047.1 hypothetical protein O1A05_05000 [Citricoccus sp. NR2]
MLSVMTLLAVAVTDLLRLLEPRLPRRAGVFVQAAWWLILTVMGLLWFSPIWWAGLAGAVVAAGWWSVAPRMESGPHVEMQSWWAVALVAVLAGGAWLDLELLEVQPPTALLWLAVVLFLTQTGNRITRAILELSGRSVAGAAGGSVPASTLKGGRVIGPLERIFITVLALVGAYHVVAALMAAKGIVRFPEISAEAKRAEERREDEAAGTVASGTKAEEFLVGSLASWGLAGGAALLAWLLM